MTKEKTLRDGINEALRQLGEMQDQYADDSVSGHLAHLSAHLMGTLMEADAHEPAGELAEEVDGRDCAIAFNAIQHYLGSETAHLKPAEQYAVFKRVARSLERDCDEMVREAASALNRSGGS